MILFVTGQYAGAQYIHPLIQRWNNTSSPYWQLVATDTSCKYWDEMNITYKYMSKESSESISAYIELIKPSLILVSTSARINLEFIFIIEGKKKNIPTASYIDIWNNYLDRFQYEGEVVFPDKVLAIDDRCASEMMAKGVPENIIQIVGQPYLEMVVESTPELGENLLIASQPVSKHSKQSLGYDETVFCNICLKAVALMDIEQVHFTRHPDENEVSNIERFPAVMWSLGRGLDDIKDCHTVLGMYSMQMVLGYLWGRKVASIQPGLCKEDPSPLSRWGLIPKIEDIEDLVYFLKKPNETVQNIELKDILIGSTKRLEMFCLSG